MANEHKHPTGLLHIYAQGAWHEEAYIVGNVEAMTALRDALNKVVSAHGNGSIILADDAVEKEDCEFWANDGEGYPLRVILLNGDYDKGKKWLKLITPYTEEIANDKLRDTIKPWEL